METFEELSNEEAGKLVKHLFKYVNDLDPETDDKIIKLSFIPIKQTLKRDLKKWESKAKANKINGQKGGRPKNPKNPLGFEGNPKEPKKAVKVNVKDKVIVNVKVNDIYKKCILHFPERLIPTDEKIILKWKEEIEKLNRIDNIPFEWIVKIVQYARNDEFWKTNFLSLLKLRKKNSEGMKYIQVFYERMKAENERASKKNNLSHINFESE
jgi:hypothetical protein